jgi:3',5'-cyclic AMP phosphodiesterase CpdA
MPAYLPPLPRREFLARLLAASAVLAVQPLWAARAPRKAPDYFALFSDTHVAGDAGSVNRKVNMTDHLRQAAQAVLDGKDLPTDVLVAGDLALNKGEREDYQQLKRLLTSLRTGGLPLWLAMGNHDDRENFRSEFQEAGMKEMKSHEVAMVKARKANWFILDSLEKTLQTPGLLGSEQLQWLAASLDRNSKKPALIVVHHNPGTQDNIGGLKDTDALLEVLRPRKHVKALIFGHTHRWGITKDESGIHLINLPPVAYVFRDSDPSGWVEARLRKNGMDLTLRPVGPAHEAHEKTTELEWRS